MRNNMEGNRRIAETEDFSVVQMSNGHIHVSGKASGLAIHISATVMYPQETLQALADELQETYTGRVEDTFATLQALT